MDIYVITGQTATGKTERAIELAKEKNGEIINFDSRQIYKKLNIITGKDLPTSSRFNLVHTLDQKDIGFYHIDKDELIPIWLYDVVDPHVPFSSYDYKECALYVLADVSKRGKTPIFVGGTYFYLSHLLYGVPTENIAPNWEMRLFLNKLSVQELQTILIKTDSKLFNSLNESDRYNPQRLIRKIEIAHALNERGERYPNQSRQFTLPFSNFKLNFSVFHYASNNQLKNAICERVQKRIVNGALKEVENLLRDGYNEQNPGLKTIGYSQLISYLQDKITWEQAVEEWVIKEVQYAKRQITFMKKDPHLSLNWIKIQ